MTSQFSDMTSSYNFFDVVLFFLWISYWSKFHVNVITGPGVMTILFYKGLTRNPEILPNIWRLGQVKDTKFVTNVSNRMLLNVAKFQGYSLYHYWIIKGKPTRGVGEIKWLGLILLHAWTWDRNWWWVQVEF